jgi:hypothetical protein
MPTVEITAPPLTPSARLRAAMRITRWLGDHGAIVSHVVVRFAAAEPMSYFAGGVPTTRYADDAEKPARTAAWASVVCHVHPARDRAYRAALAREIREALGVTEAGGHFVCRFSDTDPSDVVYLDGGDLTTARPAMAAAHQPQTGGR